MCSRKDSGKEKQTLPAVLRTAHSCLQPAKRGPNGLSGWYTSADGGTCVLDSSGNAETVKVTDNTTVLYAHWEHNDITYTSKNATYHTKTSSCGAIKNVTEQHTLIEDEESKVAATCTTAGSYKSNCKYCSYTSSNTTKALGHDWSEKKYTNSTGPTCTSGASYTRTCNRCNEPDSGTDSALGHSVSSWTTIQEADCKTSTNGYATGTCGRCYKTIHKTLYCYHDYEITSRTPESYYWVETVETASRCNHIYKSYFACGQYYYMTNYDHPITGSSHGHSSDSSCAYDCPSPPSGGTAIHVIETCKTCGFSHSYHT